MKTIRFIVVFIILGTVSLLAQYMSAPQLSGIGLPYFRTGLFRYFTEDGQKNLVKFYVQMINDDLTFVKNENLFEADIQIELYITSPQKKYVFNRTIDKVITTSDFGETNSRQIMHTFVTEVPLNPGDYNAILTVRDQNSGKQVNRKINFTLKDVTQYNFLMSDVLCFEKFTTDSSGRIISFEPILNNNFSGAHDYIYFYFRTISRGVSDSTKINFSIIDVNHAIVYENQYYLSGMSGVKEHFIRLNRDQFVQSRYELRIVGKLGNQTFKTRKIFSFFWTISPESPRDLDLALRQMRYIVPWDTLKKVLKQSFAEKQKFFKNFWKEMDPNPETEKNELLDEYFRRVNYANQNFSGMGEDGWLTDRGRIFIKFGEPDDIERHPFESNSLPYEIWRYYNLRKVFVFIDRTGFGDYYLHPDYLDEEFN